MAFFGQSGPGSLTGGGGSPDDQTKKIIEQLQKAYPQLGQPQQPGSAPNTPTSIAQLGYGFQGPQLYNGQNTAGSNPFGSVTGLFERASGVSADSITSALSSGQVGPTYSGAQTGVGTAALAPTGGGGQGSPFGQFSTAGYGTAGLVPDTGTGGSAAPNALAGSQGTTVDVAGAVKGLSSLYNMFAGTQPTAGNANAGTNPALAQQRQGEQQNLTSAGLPTGQTQNEAGALYQPGGLFAPPVEGISAAAPFGGQGTFTLEGTSPDNLLTAPGGSAQFSLGANTQLQSPLDQTTTSALTQAGVPAAQDQGFLNYLQNLSPGQALSGAAALAGGLSGLQNIYGATQSGNPIQGIAGGGQVAGSAAYLIPKLFPQLAADYPALAGGLGLAGAGAGLVGGGYGLYQGIQQGNPVQALGGAASLYSSAVPLVNAGVQALGGGANTLPTLTSLAGQGIDYLSGLFSGGAGAAGGAAEAGAAGAEAGAAGAGAGAAEAGAAGAEAGAAGAGAGGAIGGGVGLAGGIAALPLAAIVGFQTAQSIGDTNKAAAGAMQAYRQLSTSIPGAEQQLSQVPGLVQQLQGATPDQAQKIMGQLNDSLAPFAPGSGLYDFLRAGTTVAGGGQYGQDVGVKFQPGPGLLQQLQPYMNAAQLGELRAEDILGRGGMTQQQLQGLPGYQDPAAFAENAGANNFGAVFAPTDPTIGTGLNLTAGYQGAYGPGYSMTPAGYRNDQLMQQIQGLQPGGYEQGLANLLQGYGGIPGGGSAGFLGMTPLAANAPAMAGLPMQAPSILPSYSFLPGTVPTQQAVSAVNQAQAAQQYDPTAQANAYQLALQYGGGGNLGGAIGG